MNKRLIPLLVLAIVLASAPVAMADHCSICRNNNCRPAVTGGKPSCDIVSGVCTLSGLTCSGPHPVIEEPFASEFTVASVERLDEQQQPAPSEPRIASLEITPNAHP